MYHFYISLSKRVLIFASPHSLHPSTQCLPMLYGRDSEPLRFLSGSLAGVSAVACTYPLDLVRARLAFQGLCLGIISWSKRKGGEGGG